MYAIWNKLIVARVAIHVTIFFSRSKHALQLHSGFAENVAKMDSATSDTGDSDVSVRSYSTVPTPSDWMDMMDEGPKQVLISDLPEEVLEIILCKLSPYRDLKSGTLVCKQWHRVIRGELPMTSLNQNERSFR